MAPRRSAWGSAAARALAVLIAAIGCGAGSGGFRPPEPTAAQIEEIALLDEVSAEKTCLPFPSEGQACGSGATAVLEDVPPPSEVTLSLDLSERSRVECSMLDGRNHCAFQVVVDTTGFPEGSDFFATLLVRDPWSGSYTAEPKPLDPLAQPGQYGGVVKLDLPPESEATVVLGILAYVPPDEPDPRLVRRSQELLADYLASVVFAVSDLTVFRGG